jgi:hypothetical protein
MHNEFTAVFERAGDWVIAYCPEIPARTDKVAPRRKLEQAWSMRLP